MHKRIISLLLVVVTVFGMTISVGAAAQEDAIAEVQEPIDIIPYDLYTKNVNTYLSISSGTANCKAVFNGYNGTTTKVTITMTLQKKALLGLYWSDVTSWSATYNSYNATMEKSYSGLSSGTYRVKAVYTAYSGTSSETITDYSGTVKY